MNHAQVISQMIEIAPLTQDEFLQVAETLTRVGLVKREDGKKPKLYQTAYVLHKQGRYYIAHFRQLYQLDMKRAKPATVEDLDRLNNISIMLQNWGLVDIIEPLQQIEGLKTVVVKHADRSNYDLTPTYKIGIKKGNA